MKIDVEVVATRLETYGEFAWAGLLLVTGVLFFIPLVVVVSPLALLGWAVTKLYDFTRKPS